jgi:hypothetical protein
MKYKLLLTALTITLLSACSNNRTDEENGPDQVTNSITPMHTDSPANNGNRSEVTIGDTGEWAGNVRLPITGTEIKPDGSTLLTVSATVNGKEIALSVILPKVKKDGKGFRQENIVIVSKGEQSDRFLEVLADLYKVKQPHKKFIDQIKLTYVDLNEMAALMGGKSEPSDETELKLFYEDEKDAEAGFELYLNYNMKKGWLEFAEKDEAYRDNIVKAFSSK